MVFNKIWCIVIIALFCVSSHLFAMKRDASQISTIEEKQLPLEIILYIFTFIKDDLATIQLVSKDWHLITQLIALNSLDTKHEKARRAIKKGNEALLRLLAQFNDLEVNKCDTSSTLLYLASSEDKPELVKILLEKGAKVDLCYGTDPTPLYLACQKGRLSSVKLLDEHKADWQARFKGQFTPLYVASRNGHTNIVRYALTIPGIDIDATDDDGSTSLYVACQNGHDGVVNVLLCAGALPLAFQGGYTPLYVASQNGYHKIVGPLVAMFPEILNDITPNNGFPLYVAAQNNHIECVQILLQAGADTKILTNGFTALYKAAWKEHLDIVKLFIQFGADINALSHGQTVLHVAVIKKNNDMVIFLLKSHVDITIANNEGKTARDLALDRGSDEIVKLFDLPSSNSKIFADTEGDNTTKEVTISVGKTGDGMCW